MKKLRLILFHFLISFNAFSQAIIVDHNCTKPEQIPQDYLQQARTYLHIAYGHTSHGSQLITGMNAIESAWGDDFAFSSGLTNDKLEINESLGGDVGYYPQWVNNTRAFLEDETNTRFNVIMWSWCGQLSSLSEQQVWDHYLTPMTQLENDYPDIQFVYMTGHLDGSGIDGTLNVNNEIIRSYCLENNKILYDFADIESYDPDGNYFLDRRADDECRYDSNNDGSRDANWAIEWCATNPDSYLLTGSCAHSEGLNCEYKGRVAWWLYARLVGWSDEITAIKEKYALDWAYFNSLTNELVVRDISGKSFYFELYSLSGRKIDQGIFTNRLSLSFVLSGLYFVRLCDGLESQVVKIRK